MMGWGDERGFTPIRVRLEIPKGCVMPAGDYVGYAGCAGDLICPAGTGGAWVAFDGCGKHQYIGCPIHFLQRIDGGG
jgi:hypothetical protein